MSSNNSSKPPPGFASGPNHQPPLQNNGMGMQNQPQMGASNHQNQHMMTSFMPNMQPSMNMPPFMNAANHPFPMQNNQMQMPHVSMACPPQGQSHVGYGLQNSVGNASYNPMFPVPGHVMQHNAHILAQSILNILQQPNMNIPNGQFCAPFPGQNMNQQQLPMQMPNPSQVVPFGMNPGSGPMFGFQGQLPQGVIPQNPMFSANPQMCPVPGNQVRPQFDQSGKNPAQSNGNTNASLPLPFPSQQFQGNSSASHNPSSMQLHDTHNSQPSPFTNSHSQANPNSNTKTNVPNSNWKGSTNKNINYKQNRGGFQGGFQKPKFQDINNGKRKIEFPKDRKGKGLNNGRAGQFGKNSKEYTQEPKRSFSVTYTEQEIQKWREARKKNHPSNNIQKKQSEHLNSSRVDRVVLQRELKEVLAKQAELGIEVAEVPVHYLKDSEAQDLRSEGKSTFADKRKFQNKFNKKSDRKGRFSKKQKLSDKDLSEKPSLGKRNPTLLQKLLSADIKRDKSHLLQVFRFMAMNSFFKGCPDKPLTYPSVVVTQGGAEGQYLHAPKDFLKHDNGKAVQKNGNPSNEGVYVSEDEENDDDDKNETTLHINPWPREPSSSAKHKGVAIQKSDEEEGEIID